VLWRHGFENDRPWTRLNNRFFLDFIFYARNVNKVVFLQQINGFSCDYNVKLSRKHQSSLSWRMHTISGAYKVKDLITLSTITWFNLTTKNPIQSVQPSHTLKYLNSWMKKSYIILNLWPFSVFRQNIKAISLLLILFTSCHTLCYISEFMPIYMFKG
jgi:hypothetical protein